MVKFCKYSFILALVAFIASGMVSCKDEQEKSELVIVDNFRHYHSISQGKIMDLIFEIKDTCDVPLYIEEIQASSGLHFEDELPVTVLPNKSHFLHFKYDSNKNIGIVKHYINIYANLPDSAYRSIYFDVHVVLPGDYYHDYEQRYYDIIEKNLDVKKMVDGDIGEKGYITQDEIEAFQRENELEKVGHELLSK